MQHIELVGIWQKRKKSHALGGGEECPFIELNTGPMQDSNASHVTDSRFNYLITIVQDIIQ